MMRLKMLAIAVAVAAGLIGFGPASAPNAAPLAATSADLVAGEAGATQVQFRRRRVGRGFRRPRAIYRPFVRPRRFYGRRFVRPRFYGRRAYGRRFARPRAGFYRRPLYRPYRAYGRRRFY